MEAESIDSMSQASDKSTSDVGQRNFSSGESKPKPTLPAPTASSWASRLQQSLGAIPDSQSVNAGISVLARFTRGFGSQKPAVDSLQDKDIAEDNTVGVGQQFAALETFTKGIVDSSKSAVKAMQVKARHIVSQNKRRHQDGGFDLDMTYITENIIAMGFPAGSLTSGFFGYLEGFYRNHMEEVIKFFETHHKGKYKVYNLCSERLYDASLFEGKVASFPFDDHNCPPIQLISLFCQSAFAWLKEDIQNVVVVHCKAGMARTGLMICSLLLYLKFFPTADEAIEYYNQKRCVDGKALILPSQIRYVKYFHRVLTDFKGENPPGHRCLLRGFRLHKCPYWVRPSITITDHNGILFSSKKHKKTKDLIPEDFWIKAARKGIVVFALPGEPGLTELSGDFKIHFHDRQGDFYCWFNTTMMENRIILDGSELDGFDKRKLPSPGFQVEIVMIDYDGNSPTTSKPNSSENKSAGNTGSGVRVEVNKKQQSSHSEDNDDVFSDSDGEEKGAANRVTKPVSESNTTSEQIENLARTTDHMVLESARYSEDKIVSQEATRDGTKKPDMDIEALPKLDSAGASDIKAMAADASVFTFGDEEDFDSD